VPNDKLRGYIIDLRNNPGGPARPGDLGLRLVPRARRDRLDARPQRRGDPALFGARGRPHQGQAIIVLVNGGSASASEIVAGALQDHKRATVLGTRSFGKGSVQTIIPLGNNNGALRLTTARYYTPSGKSIQAKGIVPDIEVLQDVPDDLKARADSQGRVLAARSPQGAGRRGEDRLAVLHPAGAEERQGAQHGARPAARYQDQPGLPAEHQGRARRRTDQAGQVKILDGAAWPPRFICGRVATHGKRSVNARRLGCVSAPGPAAEPLLSTEEPTDDLSKPLGKAAKKKRFAVPLPLVHAPSRACSALASPWCGLDPVRRRAVRRRADGLVSADTRASPQPAKAGDAAQGSAPRPKPDAVAPPTALADGDRPSGAKTVTIIDGTTGKRQEVTVGAARQPPAPKPVPRVPGLTPNRTSRSTRGSWKNHATARSRKSPRTAHALRRSMRVRSSRRPAAPTSRASRS
jgi:hypothetical protein